jgi:hypothetical protein
MADQITPPLILEKPAKPQKYAHREVLGRGALPRDHEEKLNTIAPWRGERVGHHSLKRVT